jgi:D-alanyl-lipoteichoic acid acyltransferase DltB (MBOAT superfamily)
MNIVTQGLGDLFSFLESFAWIGTSTHIIKLPGLDAQIQPIADSLGMQLPLIKYTVSLFLAFPLAAILRFIPNKNLKHLYSMLGGIFLAQWIFGPDWIHTFISSTVTYIICLIAPKKQQHLIAFVFVMGYMTLAHIYRMYVSYMSGIFDFTGMQMVLTMKLTSFAYNYFDGTADRERVFATHEDKKVAKIYDDRKRFAIEKMPNPLEFYGYVYCFTCLLAGPAFEFNDYVRSIDGSAFDKDGKQMVKEPSSLLPGLHAMFIGIISLVAHLQISGRFPVSTLYNKEFIASTSMVQRLGFMWVALTGDRIKYYFAWKVAEAASLMGGFGFEGYDKNGKSKGWRGVENVNIIEFETAANVQVLSRSWNKRTQGWLERYTYKRTGNSLVATYFISALWHGLYPGFFIFFMSVPFVTNIERVTKMKINPIIVPGYDGKER